MKKRPDWEKLNQPDFIARVQAGVDTAYRELDKELFPYFRNFVYKEYGLDKEEARDLVQDVAIRIFEKIRSFDPTRGRFETWAFQILRNLFVDWLRDKKKYKATSLMKKQKEFEDLLLRRAKISSRKPFNSKDVLQILTRYDEPPDWAKQTDEKLIARINEAKTKRVAMTEALFRNPAQIHSLGELLDSTLIIKNMFISQLAQELDMTAEEIEDYIENRLPTQSLREDQMQKLAALTGIAIEEIQRIAGETAKAAEMKTRTASKSTQESPRRPYPTPSGHSTVGMIRDEESSD